MNREANAQAKHEAKTNPVPRPETEPSTSGSSVSSPKAVSRPPKWTAQDFIEATGRIQMGLRTLQAQMTELRAWIASLPLPEDEAGFNEDVGLALVRNTAHEYTDSSLADELALRGADREFIDRALLVAAEVRRGVPA